MVLQNYQNLIELTSNMIYIVSLGGGFKFPRKIHLNTQSPAPPTDFQTFLRSWYEAANQPDSKLNTK